MTQHVVIVGAGPGGLTAAILCASAGLQVTLFERREQAGGRTSGFELEGFRFDLGPTFFLYPQVLAEIFAAAGTRLDEHVELLRLDPQYHLRFGAGGELRATPDRERMRAEIARLSPGDAAGLDCFLEDNRQKFARFRPSLESAFESWRDLLRPEMLRLLPLLSPWRSLDGELRRYFQDPRVRLAFAFQSKYLGMSPFQCPSLFSILSYLEYEHGVYHPRGGCGAVSEAMLRVARSLGVDVRLNEPVEELCCQARRVTGVRTRLGAYAADAVVLNADFARAMQRLVADRLRRRWSDRRLATKRYSCSTFMLFLGIEGRVDELAHHTIYLSADYERNLDDISRRHVLSEDPSYYVQNACVTDPALAPPGGSTLYVLVPCTHEHPHVDWRQESERYRRLVLARLARIGLSDIERRIRVERVLTPRDWDQQYEIYRGATFNLAHTWRQMLHLRPHNRFEELDGLYLVGGGTHPGSGLPVIFEGARISTRLLLEDLGRSSEVARPRSMASGPPRLPPKRRTSALANS